MVSGRSFLKIVQMKEMPLNSSSQMSSKVTNPSSAVSKDLFLIFWVFPEM